MWRAWRRRVRREGSRSGGVREVRVGQAAIRVRGGVGVRAGRAIPTRLPGLGGGPRAGLRESGGGDRRGGAVLGADCSLEHLCPAVLSNDEVSYST
jgi:hypothetical protein